MDKDKIKELEKVDARWAALCLGDLPISRSKDFVLPDVMGYGTTINEYISNFDEFKQLLQLGIDTREALKDISYSITPIFKKNLGDANTVLTVNEITLTYTLDGNKKVLDLRLSTIYVFKESKWKVLHWHGSLGMDEEDGTWHQEEWKRENEKLQQKVNEQTEELKKSFEELKATQNQLIHAEKMASLGELTAGIAHEIQNPLNFVNNFSEVSNELIDEMAEELNNGDIEEAKAIAEDVKQNLEKINHHGKRADSIVKGMLQHSRNSTDDKEETDINKLADEYLRLAYHGHRAKDKSFNATLETNFDKSIDLIQVIPQDIGRVILNLVTNAFYAVDEKQKALYEKGNSNYKPTVTVTTKKEEKLVSIAVKDNGGGIPKSVRKKIFEPFYTTKPTGKGTGLGLSMSYDIVTKGHDGELKVESETGGETIFIIELPL
ncbi:nuclear transport factor 2 family protein [Winogradskyella sp. DF17]|uniref:histidine kinase n=1 Tax=Winogradskyella pelagia TaxID=2819984 RepID=A0ABS3T355_9FLAO|nr:ATP-binding protein [Winogradskyella sp. DF17]MBO3117171.1 nuclear transport factor 2 family protein [Winogradskyella sp. DF17]